MKGGQPAFAAVFAAIFLVLGGCAIGGGAAPKIAKTPVAERDLLSEAAKEVETVKWPAPEPTPIMAWITGGGKKGRFTKSDAAAFYVANLPATGARFPLLLDDARDTLADAAALHQAALFTADAQRVSMNDIALVEEAIQTLRNHRDIYAAAARVLEKSGDPVDGDQFKIVQDDFATIIKLLGEAADDLADRHENDHSASYAAPDRIIPGNASEL